MEMAKSFAQSEKYLLSFVPFTSKKLPIPVSAELQYSDQIFRAIFPLNMFYFVYI